jgi:hypothetical protein
MEYRQLRPFREFFDEGVKQKGRLLNLAVELARRYLGEVSTSPKEAREACLDKSSNGDCNKECKESTGDSDLTDTKANSISKVPQKKMDDPLKNNKILDENLNKRRPVVKSAEMNIRKLKKSQEQKVESKRKPVLLEPIKEHRKLSSSSMPIAKQSIQPVPEPILATRIAMESIELKDVVGVADKLAEALKFLRDNPVTVTRDHRESVYAKINEFCCHCRNKSDGELKELVKQRLGSYLTVILHLLNEINEQKNSFFTIAVDHLSQMLALLKQKIFVNVG